MKTGKRIISIIVALVMLLSIFTGCGKTETPSGASGTVNVDTNWATKENGDPMPMEEYARSIWYGFAPEELLNQDPDSTTITWKQYCQMIHSMLMCKNTAMAEEWLQLASLALKSDQAMVRDQGCFVLYRAAELMGEAFNDDNGYLRAASTNPHLLPSNDGTLPFLFDYTPFTGQGHDAWVFEDNHEGLFGAMRYYDAAMMFCQFRMSLCSFETLYNTRLDIIGPLTLREAAVSVLRLYECTEDVSDQFWLEQIDKISAEAAANGEPEAVTALREQILNSESAIVKSDTLIPGKTYTGTAYYVSPNGNDNNDGRSPERAWRTVDRVNENGFSYGDAVFFERGGTYRGVLYLYDPEGYVTVSAYGEGKKPVLTSSPECAAAAEKWTLWHEDNGVKIWKYYKDCLDCGLIVFDDTYIGNKILADWSGKQWVNEDGTPFDIASALTENLDFFSDDAGKFGGARDFYVNDCTAEDVQYGPLYLRCDQGNPGEVYDCIELCTMVTTEMTGGAYEGTVLNGIFGAVYDNLCVKYYPMGGICVGPNPDCVVQNCEIAWGGGCVQYVQNGKVTGQMGDAINGCGTENCAITGNYIHDIVASPLIIEAYSDVAVKNIDISGNLIERCNNGINISGNENTSFENVSFDDNIFYLLGVSDLGKYDIRRGTCISEWTACFRFRDPYEYTGCTISGNQMYYPLQFFYYCDVPMPAMTDNVCVPSKHNLLFADIRYDAEVGPYYPAYMAESEQIMKNVFGDTTSAVK